jgi:DNA processing protein
LRSGTLTTARYANDLGREVFAVPGHPLDPRAEGTNRLIKQGATLVTDVEDVIETLQPIIGRQAFREAVDETDFASASETPRTSLQPISPTVAVRRQPDGPEDISAVLEALSPAPIAIDVIARGTGLTIQSVQIALLELDLAGRVERHGLSLVSLKAP